MPVGPGAGAELEPPELGFDAVSDVGVAVLTGVVVVPVLVCCAVDASVTAGVAAGAEWCAVGTWW